MQALYVLTLGVPVLLMLDTTYERIGQLSNAQAPVW
jgi:hypothetical protein